MSQPIKLEQVLQKYMPIQFSTILPALKLYSLVEVYEPIEFMSILSKSKILPIMEVQEPVDFTSILKTAKCRLNSIMEEKTAQLLPVEEATATTFGQILPVEQEPVLEGFTTDGFDDEAFLFEDEFTQLHSSVITSKTDEFRQLEQEAADDIDFGHADEPFDIPESIQSPKKMQCRRCKTVKSSLDGHYWSVSSSRRRRKSSRVRRQPDFFTPS